MKEEAAEKVEGKGEVIVESDAEEVPLASVLPLGMGNTTPVLEVHGLALSVPQAQEDCEGEGEVAGGGGE